MASMPTDCHSAIAKKLEKGYATQMPDGTLYGEALLKPTNIYASTIQQLLKSGINIHYIANITGHGFRKIMRARTEFTYVLEKYFPPQEVFLFMQQEAGLSEYEMYDEFNMGNDYALFISPKDVERAQKVISDCGFESIDAGYVKTGKKQVILRDKDIIFSADRLDLR
jgi:phosphoribosylformylglycinamidine cyclo-ligase